MRDRERTAGFRLPEGVSAVNLARYGVQSVSSLDQAPTWDDVAWLQAQTRLPILLKGILHVADARQAASLGLAGVIVSNHGGRTLDTSPATAWVLPGIADAVGTDLAVLVDGGIRRAPSAQGHGPGRARGAGPPALVTVWHVPARKAWPTCCACCATNWKSP